MNTPNVIDAQNATANAISNANPEWKSEDFAASAKRAGDRASKATSITRERRMLQRSKLISAVCADYRAHFAAIYGKTDRLPSEVFEEIEKAVDNYIQESLNVVHKLNVIGMRRSFYHDHKNMSITERATVTGENQLAHKEQLFGVNLMIGAAERKLRELEAKPTPDHEREQSVKVTLMKLNVTKNFIEAEIRHQDKLQAETKAA